MQSIIAEYPTEIEAAQAVRSLEDQVSIQDIVIADLNQKIWRKLRPSEGRHFAEGTRFVVLMRGVPEDIELARRQLS